MHTDFMVMVDFDSTLFDARRFGADLWQEVSKITGRPAERIIDDIALFHQGLDGRYYDFVRHMAAYDIEITDICNRITALVQKNGYLYDDSANFIRSLQAEGFRPHILSFGEAHIQKTKIEAAVPLLTGKNPPASLGLTIVMEPKTDHIARTYPGARGVLIDDIPDQRLPKGFNEVHLQRSRAFAKPQVLDNKYVVSNLVQAHQVIQDIFRADHRPD